MRHGHLRDYFAGASVKHLSAVDADPSRSNQHEIGTTRNMRDQFLAENQREKFSVVYIWLGQDQDGFSVAGQATHYDTREHKPNRSPEWRLYYETNGVTETMRESDTLFLAMDPNRVLYFIVTPNGSTSERQLSWLFGLSPRGRSFVSREIEKNGAELDFAARFILDEIGIEFEDPDTDKLDSIIEMFGDTFPRPMELSDLARLTLPDITADENPDVALVAWLSHEESLFRRLERRIVAHRLERGFTHDNTTDVEAFLGFSQGIQNRRRTRLRQSLVNHIEAIFERQKLDYVRDAVTENNERPNFLFPNIEAYRSALPEDSTSLSMLSVYASCRIRWRQVLSQAKKIKRKHLLTLEPGIPESQTNQMDFEHLQLVVPQSIQVSYTKSQQRWLWTLDQFIQYRKSL